MGSLAIRMGVAVRQVDGDLAAAVRGYPASLSVTHIAALQGWEPKLKRVESVLAMYEAAEFARLSPLQRTLEANRCHCEALLALGRAGELKLDEPERLRLTQRAVGILPTGEGERFVELASCAELEPHYMTSNPARLVSGVNEVEKEMGLPTALGYGSLLMAGVRSRADLLKYGTRIEQLFERVVLRPAVRSILETMKVSGLKSLDHADRTRLLRGVRDALWSERAERVGAPFLLTQVIDGYLGLRPGGVGDTLGLAVVDSIILGKLAFPVRHLARGDRVYMEIAASGRGTEYWDPTDRDGTVPVAVCRRVGVVELLLRGYERMARGYANHNQHANGERIANWMLAMKADYAPAHQLLGQCLLGQNRAREAVAACAKALESDSRLADAHLTQGNALSALNRWAEAVESYKRAIHLQVGFAEAYNNLGLALWRSGQQERAIGAFKEAVRVRPDYAEAYYNLGTLHVEMERPEAAIEAFGRAVAIAPGFAQAHYNLGLVHYGRKDLAAALAAYQAAVRANPKHAGAWHNLGIVYRDMGQQQLAVEAIEKAVQLNPILLR